MKGKIRRIWKEQLENFVAKEDIEDVVDMIIEDQVSMDTFLSNFFKIAGGSSHLTLSDFFLPRPLKQPSPSAICFASPIERAPGIPLWFYAAYPDVMKWFNKKQKEYLGNNKTPDSFSKEVFGIKGMDSEKSMVNGEGNIKLEYLRNMVEFYKKNVGKTLETKVEKGTKNDIYMGQEILDRLGVESNFTLIAEITTKFYLELEKKYAKFFTDEASLLATAGILDAQWYVFSGKIQPGKILDLAKNSIESKDPLLSFIIKLEIELLKFDSPDIFDVDSSDIGTNIERVVKGEEDNIKEAIEKTKKGYVGELRIISDTAGFMESNEFNWIKEMMGIIKK